MPERLTVLPERLWEAFRKSRDNPGGCCRHYRLGDRKPACPEGARNAYPEGGKGPQAPMTPKGYAGATTSSVTISIASKEAINNY